MIHVQPFPSLETFLACGSSQPPCWLTLVYPSLAGDGAHVAPFSPLQSSPDPAALPRPRALQCPPNPAPEPPSSLLCIPQHEQEQGRAGTGENNKRKGLSHLSDIPVGCMGTRLVTSMVEYRAKSWERALG